MRFADRVAIVTGAAGNLGSAIARELAGQGAKLALVDHGGDRVRTLAASLPNADVLAITGVDLRKESDARRIADETLARFGRIDALTNTVGTFRMGRIEEEETAAQWSMLMDLNALSALLISRAVLPAMTQAGYGRILHTSAGAAIKAGAGMGAYAASKAALLRLTESVAEEARGAGITANCILPGIIDTPQNREAMPGADTRLWVQPEAIARVAAFLLSEDAGCVSGGAIPVAG
ncbi:MAG: SDR family NAD(P)-dependent oxidoreductase [Hyphomonadaceae bacterium]